MVYEFKFDSLVNYDAGVPGISISVELRLKDSSVTILAKVDTGSDSCIFSRECGERLGFEIESGERQTFGTATGSFISYGHQVTLVTAGFSFDSTVFFAHDEAFSLNVLGRFGWLDRIIIGINDYDGKLYLSPYE
ncbi:MAG: aspartyl protease family protein [Pyrinomonadaceae bacterium]